MQELIVRHTSNVKIIAGRLAMYFNGHLSLSELEDLGIQGLLQALDRGHTFDEYINAYIHKHIINSLMQMSWVGNHLTNRLSRAFMEDAYRCKVTNAPGYQESLNQASRFLYALRVQLALQPRVFGEVGKGDFEVMQLSHVICRGHFINGFNQLTPQEKLVISLFYKEDLTLAEISQVLDLSEEEVSRLHAWALYIIGLSYKI